MTSIYSRNQSNQKNQNSIKSNSKPSFMKSMKATHFQTVNLQKNNLQSSNPFKISNLNPIKPKIVNYLHNIPPSFRILNPSKLPLNKSSSIKKINFDDIHNNSKYVEALSEDYVRKIINFRRNPNNLTQIYTIPGCVKSKVVKDDFKLKNHIKSYSKVNSQVDCLNNTYDNEYKQFVDRCISNSKEKKILRNDSNETKKILQPDSKSYFKSTFQETINKNSFISTNDRPSFGRLSSYKREEDIGYGCKGRCKITKNLFNSQIKLS